MRAPSPAGFEFLGADIQSIGKAKACEPIGFTARQLFETAGAAAGVVAVSDFAGSFPGTAFLFGGALFSGASLSKAVGFSSACGCAAALDGCSVFCPGDCDWPGCWLGLGCDVCCAHSHKAASINTMTKMFHIRPSSS